MRKDYQLKRLAAVYEVTEDEHGLTLRGLAIVPKHFPNVNRAFDWAFPKAQRKTNYEGNYFEQGTNVFLLPESMKGTAWEDIKIELFHIAREWARENQKPAVFQVWNEAGEIKFRGDVYPNGGVRRAVYDYKVTPYGKERFALERPNKPTNKNNQKQENK